ncbi:MAG: bifunctional non-ous end joining protein LigD, partial [Sphingomonadales bacterium]|nr:bifunctional non-ous end joining protein LigD [Sphingomonadales bacterium]
LDIETYNRKRDFAKTKEPRGRKLKGKGDSFVVQKHEASRLHWDFRLELDGVLKSWAVPKGPSLDPDEKRLAMRTEDHPLDYGGFEGTIPKGEYGGGTVMLWDQGRWVPEPGKDPSKTIEEGHLHFTLEGERMKGEWVMFRLKPRPGERAEPWMLKKVTDDYADPQDGDALVDNEVTSVTTGRTMAEIAAGTDVWRSNRGRQKGGRARRKPSFQLLQATLKDQKGANLAFYAFDLLIDRGEDIRKLPNIERKERLAALLKGVAPPILYGDHVIGRGEALFEEVCRQRGEGIVSKKASAPYKGTRTRNWLKIKCIQRQEFVIVGWSDSDKRLGFRSLLLATRDGKTLGYVGKVGTGFNAKTIEEMMERMRPLETQKPPVEVPRADRRGAHWIEPSLVAEIAFTEFTEDGILRHPSFIGLREDKPASQVVREVPKHLKKSETQAERPTAESFGIKITNPDRVIYPEDGLTKADLANYYAAIDPLIMIDAAQRPMTLIRCPQGRGKHCFFQKHDSGTMGEHVKHIPVKEKDGDVQDYLYFDDIRGLLACVQMGTIEFHGWGSKVDKVEYPDRLVFDLDPDVGLDFNKVKEAALRLKGLLGDLGLKTFPLLTGGKGIHVVAPLDASKDWPAVKSFADRFSRAIAEAEPEMFTANIRKVQRKGRIFLDWLRNQRGATAVMPYSARAREGAPVSAPVAWEELDHYDSGHHFSIRDADELLERASSKMLAGWGKAKQALPNA